jgi:hypothetical protein
MRWLRKDGPRGSARDSARPCPCLRVLARAVRVAGRSIGSGTGDAGNGMLGLQIGGQFIGQVARIARVNVVDRALCRIRQRSL